jgi:hypothetical protein
VALQSPDAPLERPACLGGFLLHEAGAPVSVDCEKHLRAASASTDEAVAGTWLIFPDRITSEQ